MSKNEARLGRVNEELMKAISHIITYELKNPDVTGMISVTRVKVTPDLKYAKVYVSILNPRRNDERFKRISRIYKITSSKNSEFKKYTRASI